MKRILLKPSSSPLLVAYLGLSTVWAVNTLTIFRSSWSGDDWPISQTPYWIQWRYGALTNWNIWTEAMFWNDQWMKGAGRFYPLTWIESRFVFSYLTELWQYKTYQIAMLFLAGILLVAVSFLFSKSHTFSLGTLACLSLTVQFRRDFDPHLAFAVMLPSLIIKILLAVILAYFAGKSKKWPPGTIYGILSGIIFFAAMSTYEFGFLLFPMLTVSFLIGAATDYHDSSDTGMIIQFLSKLLSIKYLPIFLSWVAYGVFVFGYLRPRAASISGVYVLGLSWSSIKVFFSQAIMGIPLVSLRNNDNSYSVTMFLLNILLAGIVIVSIRKFFRYLQNKTVRAEILSDSTKKLTTPEMLMLIFISNMIFAPGLMMAMQPSWWNRADFTHTYLGVMITEFGTALLLAFIIERSLIRNLRPVKEKTKRA